MNTVPISAGHGLFVQKHLAYTCTNKHIQHVLGMLICYFLINLIMEVVIVGYKIFIGWDNDFLQ